MKQSTLKYAILWDMDGTLIDTGEPHYITWRDTLAEVGVEYTREDFLKTFGMNNFAVLDYMYRKNPDVDLPISLIEKKENDFREIIRQGVEPMLGILDWLIRFKAWGFKQAVASSAPWANIDAELDGANIRKYFDAAISGAEMRPKPDPEVFLKTAAKLNVHPENCVVVEDSIAGVGGAKAAGMLCIAVTTTNTPEQLAKADRVYTDLPEMTEKAFLELTGWEIR